MADKLSPTFVRRTSKPGRYSDGNGLLLVIRESGGRSWIQRITIRGKRRDIGLGAYPAVDLAQAREWTAANVAVARSGGDPTITRTRTGVPSFEEAAREVIKVHAPGWKSAKHAKQWAATLEAHVYPALGSRPVSEITTADVLAALMPIWFDRHETARRVRQRVSTVMQWAVAQGHREFNPAGEALAAVLPKPGAAARRVHRPALPYGEVAGAISDSTLSKLVRDLGIAAVPHGFRSSFRDWAAECTSAPHRVTHRRNVCMGK